jgi:hypothetical protein
MWSGPPACNGGILAAVVDLHTRARWQECHRCGPEARSTGSRLPHKPEAG